MKYEIYLLFFSLYIWNLGVKRDTKLYGLLVKNPHYFSSKFNSAILRKLTYNANMFAVFTSHIFVPRNEISRINIFDKLWARNIYIDTVANNKNIFLNLQRNNISDIKNARECILSEREEQLSAHHAWQMKSLFSLTSVGSKIIIVCRLC